MADREPLLSADWYRVAVMRPRLRSGVRVSRQQVRGETWYVLSDPLSGRHHRFNDVAYALIGSCNGQATLDEVWAARVEADGDAAPSQDETIRVIAQAFSAGLLVGDIAPDAAAIVKAHDQRRKRKRRAAVNPLSLRVPLWDPDAWLTAVLPRLRWMFHPLTWLGGGMVVLAALLLMVANAGALATAVRDELGAGRMLLLLWLAYPPLKALHEFAHAAAVKVRGGEVHEVGLALMMLTPVPYVDASASAGFSNKRRRIEVAAAGIAVEMLVASLAFFAWLALEPGLARDAALAVVVVGFLSTVVVNANPLLRFDGYHVLCDAAELPNLAPRSTQYGLYLLRRHVFGVTQPRFGRLAPGERPWLVAYAPLSWAYRAVLLVGLAVLVAQWSAVLGLIALALGAWWVFIRPAFGAVRWLAVSPALRGRRVPAVSIAACALASVVVAAFVVPLPDRSHAPAVVWLPDDAQVRLGTDGSLERYLVADGTVVGAGEPIAQLENEPLRAQLARAAATLQAAQVEQAQWRDSDPARATWMNEEIARLTAEHDTLQRRVDALTVRAAVAGRVVIDARRIPPGRHLPQGELLAQVLPAGAPMVRALVRNDDIALVREHPGAIRVQLAHGDGRAQRAELIGAVPRASTQLPSTALGESVGGPIPLDPADKTGRTAREPRFAIDLRLPERTIAHLGARAMVTFHHGDTSAAALLGRTLRQAFLRHFER